MTPATRIRLLNWAITVIGWCFAYGIIVWVLFDMHK